MGGAASTKASFAVVDSPTTEGAKSLVSAPLDEFLTPEQFWKGYEEYARGGVDVGALGSIFGARKSHDVTEVEGGFRVHDVVDAGGEELNVLMEHKFDKEAKRWTTKVFAKEFADDKVKETVTLQELSGPFRIEVWSDRQMQRESDQTVAVIIQGLCVETLKRCGVEGKDAVAAEHHVESVVDGKLTVRTEALDVEIDKFWASYVEFLKGGLPKPLITGHKCTELEGPNWISTDTYEGGFTTYEKFVFDVENDILISYTHENDETMSEWSLVNKYHTKVLKDPVRVEIWRELCAGRKTTLQLTGIMNESIDKVIDGVSSGGGWFS